MSAPDVPPSDARGDVVVALDGDLQHPLDALPGMVARWREGWGTRHAALAARPSAGVARRHADP